ncbi:multidrug effflux MFS transporter [Labrys sp. LIt4]|uniref:multidrug effflux MFS transporter n=1 Tax=Labrys sp. LIt4 TaxID=2821355 RepID=UPI001ADECBA2|nr:multidrug effflux MFS transporter [Labrys sp. LIt4]MBP0581973.1 multidrug effflux MFS transporter [Labrys sp. LIt4]
MTDTTSRAPVVGRLGRTEFIVLVASLVAVNAFAIDIMLPGLQQIGASLGEADPNRRQLVIPAYLLGFGLLQLVFGPLSDRFGRRGPLLVGLGIYCVAALFAFSTSNFNALVALRFIQGSGAAASAVIATALVRDVFAGNQMAKIMSLVFTVLMLSPILAPSLGQGLMTVMDWRGLFGFMAGWGAIVIAWVCWRLPETLQPEHKRPLSLKAVIEGFGIVFANRISLAYIIGMAALFGALMGFLNSSQQIYRDVFSVEAMFPLFFAGGAACSALGGMVNAQLVNRYGMRLLSWLALGVFGAAALTILVAALLQALPLWLFFGLSAVQFLVFSMILSNFGALAMEPLGEVAGTAASTQGFLQMVPGAAIGILIGQVFDGTVIPLAVGYVAMVALTAACVRLMAGKGRVAG